MNTSIAKKLTGKVAEQQGLSVIVNESGSVEDIAAFFSRNRHISHLRSYPATPHLPGPPLSDNCRNWGINE